MPSVWTEYILSIGNELKDGFCLSYGRKYCEKRTKCWLPAFSPFPTMLLKAFFCRAIKTRDCLGKG